MSYKNLRKRQNECRDIDTLKMVLEDTLVELKENEKQLKEKARQDKIVKFIQETIIFGTKLPEVKMTNGTQTLTLNDITAAVSLEIQRKISNKKRELFRQWVLDTCFPKELKRLETLEDDFASLTETNMELVQEQARNQKKLKALEIIKKKRVNVADLVDCVINEKTGYDENGLEEYNGWQTRYRQLTQQEYDLLKEVLL